MALFALRGRWGLGRSSKSVAFLYVPANRAASAARFASSVKKWKNPPWRQWRRLEEFFATGQVCIIDGANGTEIQRRGGRPAETFSSGTAPLARPDLCQEVHEAYLAAGADVIITHSYSSNRNVMSPSGNGGRVHECILAAAAIARRATLNHLAIHASQMCQNAAASSSTAAHAAAAAATSAARSTTSSSTNAGALMSAQSAVVAAQLASEASAAALHAIQEVHACADAASAAAAAALAASEGEPLPEAVSPVVPSHPVRVIGWDAAGFGPALVAGSLSTHPPEIPAGGATSSRRCGHQKT